MSEATNEQMKFSPMDYSLAHYEKLAKLDLVNLYQYPYRLQERIIGEYTKEDLKKAFKAPEMPENQKILRRISKFAYNVSMHYKRLIDYVSELILFRCYLEPFGYDIESANEKRLITTFNKMGNQLLKMNIEHEYAKATKIAVRDGVFFGYVIANKDSFFIMSLDPDYCMIDGEVNGSLTFAFNFNYFLQYPERVVMYPEEFQEKYWNYIDQKNPDSSQKFVPYWQHIEYENSICIKIGDTTSFYPIPPYVSLFSDILDIQDFKEMQKSRGEIDNYKLIAMQIPQKTGDNASTNDFLLDPNWVAQFYENTKSQVPDQVGVTATTMKMDVIDFERDKPDKNKVFEAQQILWDTAGISSLLFQSNATSIGLNNSIRVDEASLFLLLRQFERWTNRYMYRFQDKKYRWNVKFLNLTIFNKGDEQDGLLKAAQYGGYKSPWIASMGYSPTSTTYLSHFENSVLKIQEKLVPLQSSHTQSGGNDEGGRPLTDENKLSDKGLEARDQQTEETRAER